MWGKQARSAFFRGGERGKKSHLRIICRRQNIKNVFVRDLSTNLQESENLRLSFCVYSQHDFKFESKEKRCEQNGSQVQMSFLQRERSEHLVQNNGNASSAHQANTSHFPSDISTPTKESGTDNVCFRG